MSMPSSSSSASGKGLLYLVQAYVVVHEELLWECMGLPKTFGHERANVSVLGFISILFRGGRTEILPTGGEASRDVGDRHTETSF